MMQVLFAVSSLSDAFAQVPQSGTMCLPVNGP
jgi:hypothetical protein